MQEFNYENNFMGVLEGKPSTYRKTFIEEYRIKKLTDFLKLKKNRLLDIGCGGGITTEALQYYYPKVKLYGCDVSKKAIDYAKKLGTGKVKYDVIKNKRLPYKDNYFDACIALDVLEHVPDIQYLLKEVKRVTKKNGLFFSHTPAEGQPLTHTWLWSKIGKGSKMTFKRYGHIHPEFTHSNLKQTLKDNGFKILKVNYSEHFIYQSLSLILYFFPLEVMEKMLKKKAEKYKDAGVITTGGKKKNNDILMSFRNLWLFTTRFLRWVTYPELDILKSYSIGALKINILAKIIK